MTALCNMRCVLNPMISGEADDVLDELIATAKECCNAQRESSQLQFISSRIYMRTTCLTLSLLASALGLTPSLRVCTVSTCGRNGARAFCDAAEALGAIAELPVESSGCMSRCRGIVVAGGPLRSTTSLDLKIENARAAMEAAASFFDDLQDDDGDFDVAAAAAVLMAKADGDAALDDEEYEEAIARYTETIESPFASNLSPADADASKPPVFRLTGRAAEQEEERLVPRRVRWLHEALVGRCRARLALALDAAGALSDARAATELCALAGAGWYRLRDAAEASGDAAAAETAAAELTRLGYALDVEGPQPTEAEKRKVEQEREAREQKEKAEAAEAARQAASAAEAARIEAEWNTPEAVAARAQEAASVALRGLLAEARKQDAEDLLHSFRWGGRGRRETLFNGHVAILAKLSEEAQAAAAAGAAGEMLDEANALVNEMEATTAAMDEMRK